VDRNERKTRKKKRKVERPVEDARAQKKNIKEQEIITNRQRRLRIKGQQRQVDYTGGGACRIASFFSLLLHIARA